MDRTDSGRETALEELPGAAAPLHADDRARPALGEFPAEEHRDGPFLQRPLPAAAVALACAAIAATSYSSLAKSILAAIFAAVLVVLAATDLERRIIPNRVVLPATVVVLIMHIAIAPGRALELVLAPLAAAAFLFLPNLINSAAMGMGDIKLALLLGAGLGWGVFGALLIGFIATTPFAIVALVRGGEAANKKMLPLGPFLVFGGLLILIVPQL
jgi:leader peptidase (prepilin peptidase)/N-methyltransferase